MWALPQEGLASVSASWKDYGLHDQQGTWQGQISITLQGMRCSSVWQKMGGSEHPDSEEKQHLLAIDCLQSVAGRGQGWGRGASQLT